MNRKVSIRYDRSEQQYFLSVSGKPPFIVCNGFASWFIESKIKDAETLWNKLDRPQWMRFFLATQCHFSEGLSIFFAHLGLKNNSGGTFSDEPDPELCVLIRKAIPWWLCFEPAVIG